jgi:hypothetical protein
MVLNIITQNTEKMLIMKILLRDVHMMKVRYEMTENHRH